MSNVPTHGRGLKEQWADGPRTRLGLQIEGFPNTLTLAGPHNAVSGYAGFTLA